MELYIKTSELQDMVSKAIKCVSNNKLIPLTSLMNIKVESNVLVLTTTDATNYFYVSKQKVACEDFEISVMADLFTKLVQKTSSDEITLVIEGAMLEVKGNGTYKMELPLNEEGKVIKFPVKCDFGALRVDEGLIQLSTIKTIINSNKASLASSIELIALTCYYCGDKVVTSDSYKICNTAIKVFEKPRLITEALMELLSVMSEENIEISTTSKDIVFETAFEKLYAPITDGVESFPIAAIDNLVNLEFKSNCKIPRSAVLSVLDRLALFVSPYDKRGIYLTFTKEGIMFSSKKSSGSELIPFIASEKFVPYTCCIDIEMLRSQVVTQDAAELILYYGSEVAIKMVNNNITQVVALMADDRMEAAK